MNFEIVPTDNCQARSCRPERPGRSTDFQSAIQAFFDEYGIETVAIRERLSKGRMKGGTITFKLEGLIQLCRQPVTLISPATIRKSISAANIDFAELPIAKFQHEAYGAA